MGQINHLLLESMLAIEYAQRPAQMLTPFQCLKSGHTNVVLSPASKQARDSRGDGLHWLCIQSFLLMYKAQTKRTIIFLILFLLCKY